MYRRLVLASALAGSCLWGCGGDAGPGYGPGNVFIDSDCDPALRVCDVLEADCQRDIWEATACQRSQKSGDLPTIREITAEEFGEEISQDVMPGGPPGAWDITLGLLGLLNPASNSGDDTVNALVEGVLGFYDSRTGVVTLLSDATGLDAESKVLVLSHEFTHVLQDRSAGFDLLGTPPSTDRLVADDALTEGEAVVHSNIALALGDDIQPDELDWDGYFASLFDGVFWAVDASRAPLVDALLQLPYPLGGGPVLKAWTADGQPGINALYTTERMVSVADWKRPYPNGIQTPRPQLDCPPPAAPPDYEVRGADVLGVVGLTALWSAHSGEAATGWEKSNRWRGGRTWVYAKGGDADSSPDGSALIWHTRWSNGDAASELVDLLADTDLFVERSGDGVVIVASDDGSVYEWAEANAADWLDCDATKRKSLQQVPLAPFRKPLPIDLTLRAQLPRLR